MSTQLVPWPLLPLLFFLSIFSGATLANDGINPIETLSEALNQSGRQRMLTQRIVKAYTQILLDVRPENASDQLDGAIILFEKQLKHLKDYNKDSNVKRLLADVEKQWTPFRDAALVKNEGTNLKTLVALNENLLKAAHQVVVGLEALSTKPAGRLVNIAGRQRMLSQRISKFYMLRAFGFRGDETKVGLESAAKQFMAAHEELSNSPENNSEIKATLKKVETQWIVFKASFQLREGEYAPLMIALSGEKVLKLMNQTTGLYAKLASD